VVNLYRISSFTLLIVIFTFNLSVHPAGVLAEEKVSFIHDIGPILVQHCQSCHGPKTAESNYRLDSFEKLKTAGDYETPPITPGNLDESELFRLITADEDERMPANGESLQESQIALIRTWIEQGAEFDGKDASAALMTQIPRSPYPQPPETYAAPIAITALEFSPTGEQLWTAGFHELLVWNVADGKLVRRVKNVAERTYQLAFSPDGSRLLLCGGSPGVSGEARLVNPESGEEILLLGTSTDLALDAAFRPDGQKVAVAYADNSVIVFDVESGKEDRMIASHGDWVTAVAWSPDGKRLATSSRDKTSKLFDAENGQIVASFGGHGQPVHGVAFNADGKQVFSAGSDNKVKAWNPDDSKEIGVVTEFGGESYKLVSQADHLFSISADHTARQHKLEDRAEVRKFEGHADWILSLAVHSSSGLLATGAFDGNVRIWKLEDGSQVADFVAVPSNAQ